MTTKYRMIGRLFVNLLNISIWVKVNNCHLPYLQDKCISKFVPFIENLPCRFAMLLYSSNEQFFFNS
jgi:hypothetical protein